MFGCFIPLVIFGFKEQVQDHMVGRENINAEKFGSVGQFTTDTVKCYATTILYGIRAILEENGELWVDETDEMELMAFYKLYKARFPDTPPPTYRFALDGDYEWLHKEHRDFGQEE